MDNNNTARTQDIALVRKQFLREYEDNKEFYDECDLEKVRNDLWVARFINFMHQGPEKGLEHMKECFRWRKSFGVNSFDRTTIPIEVYQMCPVFMYGADDSSRRTLFVRVKMHRKIDEIADRFRKSFANFVERIDATVNREFGWDIVFDCHNAGYASADLDMLFFIMPTIRRYYPNGVQKVYVCGLPWILNSFAKLALAFMPADTAKKIRFVSQQELHTRISAEHLPDFLGGSCADKYRLIPQGAKTCEQLGEELYGMTTQQVNKMMASSMKFIEEGREIAVYESSNT